MAGLPGALALNLKVIYWLTEPSQVIQHVRLLLLFKAPVSPEGPVLDGGVATC